MIKKKICMLGTLAVGKTSLVQQFTSNTFSDKYLSTIGVKVEQKVVKVEDQDITLVLWDLHGDDQFKRLETSYLRGASAYFLVADVTREDSVKALDEIYEKTKEALGDAPYVVLLNKVDLLETASKEIIKNKQLREGAVSIFLTSAKTGAGVEDAFHDLAKEVL